MRKVSKDLAAPSCKRAALTPRMPGRAMCAAWQRCRGWPLHDLMTMPETGMLGRPSTQLHPGERAQTQSKTSIKTSINTPNSNKTQHANLCQLYIEKSNRCQSRFKRSRLDAVSYLWDMPSESGQGCQPFRNRSRRSAPRGSPRAHLEELPHQSCCFLAVHFRCFGCL